VNCNSTKIRRRIYTSPIFNYEKIYFVSYRVVLHETDPETKKINFKILTHIDTHEIFRLFILGICKEISVTR
jgi:hypothetical protein